MVARQAVKESLSPQFANPDTILKPVKVNVLKKVTKGLRKSFSKKPERINL